MGATDIFHQTTGTASDACPYCHSSDTRSLKSIYDIANNYKRSSISRVAVTGGAGFYLDGSNVRPTPETLMAAKFPPPGKPKFSWWLFLSVALTAAFLVFVLVEWVGISRGYAFGAGISLLAGTYAVQRIVLQKKAGDFQKSYDEWKQIRVCLDCEKTFEPGEPSLY